jgi:hypothetical protein
MASEYNYDLTEFTWYPKERALRRETETMPGSFTVMGRNYTVRFVFSTWGNDPWNLYYSAKYVADRETTPTHLRDLHIWLRRT